MGRKANLIYDTPSVNISEFNNGEAVYCKKVSIEIRDSKYRNGISDLVFAKNIIDKKIKEIQKNIRKKKNERLK